MIPRPLQLVGAAVILLLTVALIRTARYDFERSSISPSLQVAIRDGAAERLAGSLRIRTISPEDPAVFDVEAFSALRAYLQAAFPLVHARLQRETVARDSLLFTWPGSNPALEPILLAGHLDVVPVEPGTEDKWQHDPFGGAVADGFVWGRGAIDNKSAVLGTLEAVETLLAEGFRPTRTVYLAFGHDEEVGGGGGAREVASLLRSRGVRLEMVLDEGGVISDGVLPGVSEPVALVGIAEKGFVSIELSATVAGGHSSLPPRQTAIGLVSAAVARLERAQMPARLEGPTRQLFDRIGPGFPYPQKAIFANLWLTRSLVLRRLEGSPTTNAMVRSTTAATMFQAGTKDNVLPSTARAVINFRILPGDSVAAVENHVRAAIDDPRVRVTTGGRFSAEPSSISSTNGESYHLLETAIRRIVPDATVAPYLVVVVTDARYYSGLSRDIYRFLPLRLGPRDLERIHGTNERIGIEEYEAAIRTYRELLLQRASK